MVETVVAATLSSGETLLFEVDEPLAASMPGGIAKVSLVPRAADGAIDFDGALGSVKSAAEKMFDAVRAIAVPPDSCEITFGVKLSGSMGAIIAKASTEANFTIRMTWAARKGT